VFGQSFGGTMSNEDLASLLMCDYYEILYHVQKFMRDKELRGIKETPGELALRFRNIIAAAERFKAVKRGFMNGLFALLPQLIDGKVYYVAWTVVS